jgi:hypothetical protein
MDKPIPLDPDNGNHIGMDTKYRRNGLHLWIGRHMPNMYKEGSLKDVETVFQSKSVHLTREDAQNLVDEINRRLF